MKRGFTLIELIVVMGVIGVLASGFVIVINPIGQFQKARDSQRKNDLAQLQRALETYHNDYERYPCSTNPDYLIIPGCPPNTVSIAWGQSWAPYIDVLPKDPVSTQKYIYRSPSPDNQSYYIYAHLERKNLDTQACNPDGNPDTDDACANVPAGVTCGTATDVCNFGVSSPNVSP